MAIVLTIAGSTKTIRKGSLRISQTANGHATATFTVTSADGTYRPALDAEVLITEGGTRIFGGLIDHPNERGLANGATVGIGTVITAVDFSAYIGRRYVHETLATGTLKSQLTTLVANYWTEYGITLDAGQVNGPTMPELILDYANGVDVLDQLATITASSGEPYVWRVDVFNVLKMYRPSTTAAPFNISGNTPPQVIGDLEVETTRDQYANTIIVRTPSKTEMLRTEAFTGDGTTTTFTLQYTPFKTYGYVTSAGIFETMSVLPAGGGTWAFDPATNTIARNTPPANGAAISVHFDGTFAGLGVASDAGEVASVKTWERVIQVDTVPSDTTAQAIAAAELAKRLPVTKKVKYLTLETGLQVGQTQTINVSRRNINVTAAISDIVIRDFDTTRLSREVTAIIDAAQTNLGRGFRDVYRQWFGDAAGSSSAITIGAATANGGPGGPNMANQFNDGGVFGGQSSWTFNKNTNSLVMGGGGSAITAADPQSCGVFGSNCHIAD